MPTVILECESNKFNAIQEVGQRNLAFVNHELQGSHIGLGKDFVTAGRFVFDADVLGMPEAPIVTSAYFSAECDLTRTDSQRYQVRTFAADGIWDVDAPSAAEWRAAGNGSFRVQILAAGAVSVSNGLGGSGVLKPMRKELALPGASVSPVNRASQYFKANVGVGTLDIESVELRMTSGSGSAVTAWCELWTAVAGGGGTYGLRPGTLLATSSSVSVTGILNYSFAFSAGTSLVDNTDYCIVVDFTGGADETEWIELEWKSVTVEADLGDPVEGLVYGQDQGLTFNNYPMEVQLPDATETGERWDLPLTPTGTVAGTVYNSLTDGDNAPVDFRAAVQASIDEWVPSGPKRIAVLFQALIARTHFNWTDEDIGRENPRLHLTFESDDESVILSP